MKGKILIVVACGILLASSSLASHAHSPTGSTAVTQTIHVETTYPSGSKEADLVLEWLQQHVAFRENGTAIARPEALGDLRVSYTRSGSSNAQPAASKGNPPVALPGSGNPGDVITIESTSGGILQSWTYEWRVGENGFSSWVLTSYLYQILPR